MGISRPSPERRATVQESPTRHSVLPLAQRVGPVMTRRMVPPKLTIAPGRLRPERLGALGGGGALICRDASSR
jgi:hypothetical protein